jgi:hypothetical protein
MRPVGGGRGCYPARLVCRYMKKPITLIAVVLAAAFITDAAAQTGSTPRTDGRQMSQKARIKAGEASGELNEREARKLDRGQRKVQRQENRAMKDGKVTPKERARLEKSQDKQSAQIKKQKTDGDKAK